MDFEKDLLEIIVHNSYGDSFERELEEPTCDEVISEFVTIAQQLGYPFGCIYEALLKEAEGIKDAIKVSYQHVQKVDNNK